MGKNNRKVGEAYGFFHYAGKESVNDALPHIRKETSTPPEMGLQVIQGLDNLDVSNDAGLAEIVTQAKSTRMNYVVRATLPDYANRMTANHLGDVLNGIYSSMYEPSDPFCAGIVYKRGQQYIFKRD